MRITITCDRDNLRLERGNSKEERAAAATAVLARVRCRYTPQSKQRAKDFARSQA